MNTVKIVPLSKILGCLYGQAIGDAMGMPSELWSQNRVRHYFNWIDSFLPGPAENIAAFSFKKAEITDDTQQAVALMDALLETKGEVKPEVIGKHILAWAERTNAFKHNILGPTSKAALLALNAGTAIEQIESNGITNGAAMRISPMGCLLTTKDHPRFIQLIAAACSPTHKSDIAIAGAVVIAWAISKAIEGVNWSTIKDQLPDLANDVQTAYESTISPSLCRRISLALQLANRLRQSKLDDKLALYEIYQTVGAGIDVIESIPAALAIVEFANTDPVRAAILSANLGGDTDTIGAMACAICGALNDITAFPYQWIKEINETNKIDFHSYAVSLKALRY